MAVLQCKMCGGDLKIEPGKTVCECEYCGSKQTIPSADNEKKLSLFSRANSLRAKCEFDKAAGVYESIISDFKEEAEAYWGMILCKFGIEYVDDPKTGKKIPTCHRSSFDNVLDDPDFEMVMTYSDTVARSVYREEAKEIERLRSAILEVSSKEEPYDIFICYKETDENGDRTIDSVLAQDVYDALTEKGYRVFFSRITLEDKLGLEYEPYIFAALNSAKVMLVFGTKYDYFNAVWVKNEWSRYIALMGSGEKRTLIPCYRNIDAYDIPKEFRKLQAQDLGKVGAVQDLVRGINKIFGKTNDAPSSDAIQKAIQEAVKASSSNASAGLLKKARIDIEEQDWGSALETCRSIIEKNPEEGEAYILKDMVENKCQNLESLVDYYAVEELPLSKNLLYASKFGNQDVQKKISEFNNSLKKKNEDIFNKLSYNEKIFRRAFSAVKKGDEKALTALGDCYFNGIGVTRNRDEADVYYRKAFLIATKAAQSGNLDAQVKIGDCYLYGKGTIKSEETSFKCYEKAALGNNAEGILKLGECYENGIGTDKNDEKALELYEKAASMKNLAAQNKLAWRYLNGIGVSKDIQKAFNCQKQVLEIYLKSAKEENLEAINKVADCYKNGKGCEQDDEKAHYWYEKAFQIYKTSAKNGNAEAQNKVGDCYRDGEGVDQNDSEAFKWYREAAQNNYPIAYLNVASCYDKGEGIQENKNEAEKWYEKGIAECRKKADEGDPKCLNKLGECYFNGIGVEEDKEAAFKLFQKAADQNSSEAFYNLSVCYEMGAGVDQDTEIALNWRKKATDYGYVKAEESIAKLSNRSIKEGCLIGIFILSFLIAFVIWILNYFVKVGISSSYFWYAGLVFFGIFSIYNLFNGTKDAITTFGGVLILAALIIWILNFFFYVGVSSQMFWLTGLLIVIVGTIIEKIIDRKKKNKRNKN